ncbi:hypothetical protein [Mycobacterium pseudokansasii]|uniref:hypothetical protein n=1 Tax=Mycobacterium pseudokansasii TaxID=2341080 RepID=UPI000AB324FF|nr:hypothetical protein [Mycobacterium pseudokansasii]
MRSHDAPPQQHPRANRINAERRHNRPATQAAEAQAKYVGAHDTPELPPDPDEPPPI